MSLYNGFYWDIASSVLGPLIEPFRKLVNVEQQNDAKVNGNPPAPAAKSGLAPSSDTGITARTPGGSGSYLETIAAPSPAASSQRTSTTAPPASSSKPAAASGTSSYFNTIGTSAPQSQDLTQDLTVFEGKYETGWDARRKATKLNIDRAKALPKENAVADIELLPPPEWLQDILFFGNSKTTDEQQPRAQKAVTAAPKTPQSLADVHNAFFEDIAKDWVPKLLTGLVFAVGLFELSLYSQLVAQHQSILNTQPEVIQNMPAAVESLVQQLPSALTKSNDLAEKVLPLLPEVAEKFPYTGPY